MVKGPGVVKGACMAKGVCVVGCMHAELDKFQPLTNVYCGTKLN